MSKEQIREIPLELLGILGTDPFYGTTSAARGAMYATQIGQAPLVNGSEPPRILTGMELRLAEHVYNVKFPKDCTVLNVIRKYPVGYGRDSIKSNPLTTIIYEDYYDKYKTINVVHVPEFNKLHQDFGYPLVKDPEVFNQLSAGANFPKDTVIAQSRTKGTDDGVYGVGVNANVVFMSSPGTIEDGFIASEEFLEEHMISTTYTTVVGNAGKKAFFLNLYGDKDHYKPFPDIGEPIRDDGVVFALRDLDDSLSPAEMTPRALREYDSTFDRGVIGEPGAIVKDIHVFWDERQNPTFIPSGMDGQLRKYYDALSNYYNEIIKVYRTLQARRKDKLRLSPEFNQLVVEALIFLPQNPTLKKLLRSHRLERLDEWRVEVTFESKKIPTLAYKISDEKGGKGVVCELRPKADMPVDQHGNIADFVIYGGSTFKRANFSRLYEHYWNAVIRDVIHRLRVEFGLDRHKEPTEEELNKLTTEQLEYAFIEVLDMTEIIAPTHHEIISRHPNKLEYIRNEIKKGFVQIVIPVTENIDLMEAVTQIQNSRFKPLRELITITDYDGNKKLTEDPMIIAPMSMILLEKIGDDWSAAASVKTQQFGLPARLNNSDRNATPGRESAVRTFGESETRSFNSTIGAITTNEILDQTNNPDSHRVLIENILTGDKPTNIKTGVPRNIVPLGSSRSVELLKHLLETRGIRFKYIPGEEDEVGINYDNFN